MSAPFLITVTSDTVCPWCFIGKRNLEAALAEPPTIDARVVWKPYQLDPGIPREGLDYDRFIKKKFGGDGPHLRAMRDNLMQAGASAGIAFRFDRIQRRPNTLDSHRLVHWASEGEQQNRVVEALFEAFFIEGRDVGDSAVLRAVADGCGMDGERVAVDLAEGRDAAEIRTLADGARTGGVSGVPSVRLADLLDVPGAQPPDVFRRLIERATAVIEEKRAG